VHAEAVLCARVEFSAEADLYNNPAGVSVHRDIGIPTGRKLLQNTLKACGTDHRSKAGSGRGQAFRKCSKSGSQLKQVLAVQGINRSPRFVNDEVPQHMAMLCTPRGNNTVGPSSCRVWRPHPTGLLSEGIRGVAHIAVSGPTQGGERCTGRA
jgi:hypothetical protein